MSLSLTTLQADPLPKRNAKDLRVRCQPLINNQPVLSVF